MKTKVVTFTSAPNNYGHKQLIRSLDFWQVDYHVINEPWRGFGTKIIETAKYVEGIKNEYKDFIFVDGHDTFFLQKPERRHFPHCALVSCEKACWPDSSLEHNWSGVPTRWKYPNSGSYYFPIELFMQVVAENPINPSDDDQLWLQRVILSHKYDIQLDHECDIFQSIAFLADDEYEIDISELRNKITGKWPIIIHNNGGNAKNPMEWIYNLIR